VKKIASLIKGIRPKLVFDQYGKPEFSMDFTEDKVSDKTLEEYLIYQKPWHLRVRGILCF